LTIRPNILYLHSHDTGRYVQPYGFPVETPRIQALAEEGMLFRQAFCAASTCSASRASLLTGTAAHSNGMLGLAHRGWSLHDYRWHIVHTLRTQGYHSVLIGEQHISKEPEVIGYDRVFKFSKPRASDVAPITIDVLRTIEKPFFLSVGFFETHRGFFAPARGEERYVAPPSNLPSTPETRADFAAFRASARSLDAGVGAVLDALEAEGLADETLVICTTDHGIAFPGWKTTLTDRGTGVMLILRGPGGFAGGKTSDAMVSQIDLYPTICDLLAIDRPTWLQGESLLPLASGEADEIHDAVYAEGTYHVAYEPQRAVRTRRWKFIHRFGDRTLPVPANTDDSPSKDVWLEGGWLERPIAADQLYDLVQDPNELVNLAGDPNCAEVVDDLRAKLEQWMRDTKDPLLDGPVAPPPGAEFNLPDQLSAAEPTHIFDPRRDRDG
jgi:N-sulfoglucosamine sulfohydrolase